MIFWRIIQITTCYLHELASGVPWRRIERQYYVWTGQTVMDTVEPDVQWQPVMSVDYRTQRSRSSPSTVNCKRTVTYINIAHSNIHTTFNGHFPGKSGLTRCPLVSQSPVIFITSILTGQAEHSSYPSFWSRQVRFRTGYSGLYPIHLH